MNHDLVLRVEGPLLERLLEQALKKGATFARVHRLAPRVITVAADAASAEILMGLCRRYGLDCRTLSRGGWTALLDTLRARWTLFPAMALCVLLCALCLSRIWLVDVSFTGPRPDLGNAQQIHTVLDGSGIRPGMSAAQLDTDLLQAQLMADAGDYSFIGVRRQGIRLLVEASPEVPAPQLYALNQARDLVAARDGVIESITVHSGEAVVQPGDTVRAGQLLIRGEEAKTQEETTPVSALGEVVARCWYEGHAQGALRRPVTRRTGNYGAASKLKLMGASLPMAEGPKYACAETEVEYLPIGGLFLPLEIERTTFYEAENLWEDVDLPSLKARLSMLACADAQAQMSRDGIDYQNAKAWIDFTSKDDSLRARAVYEIYTDIAVTRDALIEEVY